MFFVNTYSEHFILSTRDVTEKACQYTRGLMKAGSSKNMDRMAEVIPDATSRNIQQFLTHSTWDERPVIDHVPHNVNKLIGDSQPTGLIIVESSFAKQGKMSVGTSRQWLERLGKTDNGQVAVFGALANNRFVQPVSAGLYLPREWTKDPKRCDRAGIPKDGRKFHIKIELGLQIVEHARENRLDYGWVSAGAGYGTGPGFCIALDNMSEVFVVDVHSDFFCISGRSPPVSSREKNLKRDLQSKSIERTLIIKHEDAYPLLSCADIEDLFAYFFPRRNTTKNEVIP